MTKLYQSRTVGIILLCLLVTIQQSVVYGATANDDIKENDIKLLLQVDDKTISTTTANNDSPHHHHIKHHISLDNSDRLLGDGTSLPVDDEQQDTQQDTLSNKPMPIKGSVSGKKHQLQQHSLTSIANTNSRILLPEEEEDTQQLLVSRGGKRLLRKKRIRAQIRGNNSWGRGGNNWNNRRGKGRKSSKGWVGKGRKWGKSSKGAKNKRGWRNANWYDDDWFNEPKWDDWEKPSKDKWNDDWKNADWIAPQWESSSWSSADWKKKEIVHVEPEHDICLQNPKGKFERLSYFEHMICTNIHISNQLSYPNSSPHTPPTTALYR